MILSKNVFPFLAVLFSTLVLFSSCEKDDPEIANEEELITTLTYTLTPENGGTPVVLSFRDLDGDGGTAPVLIGGTLAANTVYNGSLNLLNELETPAESITEEIEEEDDEHQFFFAATGGLNVTVAYDDTDGQNPVGLKTKVTTGAASQGKLRVTLRHEPNKSAAGVSDGNIANAGGETDIEVEFDVVIE
ncbi:MAG: type 1 periplasmic binding fold superfamily protein [Flexibacter sp. CG_4_10_14_3_um_filter_32_15]|nr:MAG: type 1 periplasmic binding fold superfamily protein [Flexibacter sp. CG_4_10_14_3_um_filter_32_15]